MQNTNGRNSVGTPARSNEVIAHDVAVVLNADLHEKTKRAVVKNAAWAWTEASGKYEGCELWSAAARELHRAADRKGRFQGLNHEHAVPIQAFFNFLLQLPKGVSEQTVFDLFSHCMKGVVITEDEHKRLNRKFKDKMPEDFDFLSGNALARYEACEITIGPAADC